MCAQDCTINDLCSNALPLSGTGCNEGATAELSNWTPDINANESDCTDQNGNPYTSPCATNASGLGCVLWNENHNGVWYTFSVDASTVQPFDLTILNIQCTDGLELLQMGIWSNLSGTCDLFIENLEACAVADGDFTFEDLNLAFGDYFLFVDGTLGANCTWEFESEELNIVPPSACPELIPPLIPVRICENNQSTVLNVNYDVPGITGTWSFGDIPANSNASIGTLTGLFEPDSSGEYEIFYDIDNLPQGCTDVRDTFYIQVDPIYNEIVDLQICAGGTVDTLGFIFDENSAQQVLNYSSAFGCDSLVTINPVGVNNVELFPEIYACPTIASTYRNLTYFAGDQDTLFITGSGGTCDTTIYIDVQLYPNYPEINLAPEFVVEEGSSVELNTNITDSSTINLVYWNPSSSLSCIDCLYPLASPDVETEYELIINTTDDCSDTYSTIVSIAPIISPVIPTAFSPNFDGVNDDWNIKYEGSYDSFTVFVYDRWGKKVFEADSPSVAWSGINEFGKNPPLGVYMYYVRIESSELAEPFEQKGTITLIR